MIYGLCTFHQQSPLVCFISSSNAMVTLISHNLPGRLQATTNAHSERRMIKAVKFNVSWLLGQQFFSCITYPILKKQRETVSSDFLGGQFAFPFNSSCYICSCWVMTAMWQYHIKSSLLDWLAVIYQAWTKNKNGTKIKSSFLSSNVHMQSNPEHSCKSRTVIRSCRSKGPEPVDIHRLASSCELGEHHPNCGQRNVDTM